MIDIFEIAKWAAALSTIAAIVGVFVKFMKRHAKEHEEIKAVSYRNSESLEVVLHSILGILDGMIEQGLNGPVKESKLKLREFLIETKQNDKK